LNEERNWDARMSAELSGMNVKVAGDDEFMRCGCSEGKKRTEVIEEDRV